MVETISHMFGCCGENHPSLLYLLGVTPFIIMRSYVVRFWRLITLYLKSCLKRF
jgi:hypothetical protein